MLTDKIAELLRSQSNLNTAEIVAEIYGIDLDNPELMNKVELALHAGHRKYRRNRAEPLRWSLAHQPDKETSASIPMSFSADSRSVSQLAFARAQEKLPTPYSWQLEAMNAWKDGGRRGIVEAVTGSGKTMVGTLAILEALQDGGKVHIVVPTIDLQKQWLRRIVAVLPHQITIAQRGGGNNGDLDSTDILISVVNSARTLTKKGSYSKSDLIVIDECHRFASTLNSTALDAGFSRRLGLSATYRRDDGGHAKFLVPYFERVCYSLNYDRAKQDAVISRFGVVFLGVELNDTELEDYDTLSEEISRQVQIFRRKLGNSLPRDYTSLIQALLDAVAGKYSGAGTKIDETAKVVLAIMRQRRRLLESASAKLDALIALAPEITKSNGTVVFTQSIEMAALSAQALTSAGIEASAIHSGSDKDVRDYHIRRFGRGELKAVIAPRILDEGIDFPDADLAVVLAASNTRRQMIQRMGRVMRAKPDHQLARLVIIFAENTVEDPRFGAHEMFSNDISNAADKVALFLHDDYPGAIQLLQSFHSCEL